MLKSIKHPTTWLVLLGVVTLVLAAAYLIPTFTGDDSTVQASEDETAASEVVTQTGTGEGAKILTEDDRPLRLKAATSSWDTNWNKHTIQYDELLSGGPPRDGIPSIDDPKFVSPSEAEAWLAENEPVIALEIEGEARAYPLQILTWHEIVNDTVADVPVAVTFCPLCNSAITFDRRFNGQVFEFGTSGLLRNSDLVMYDRTTETLWQQFTGEGIVGDLAGEQLEFLPSSIISFGDFREAHPDGLVLSRETGFNRNYGQNPYAGYDAIGNNPFLFDGPVDGRLSAMERVVTLTLDDPETGETVDIAYPLSILSEAGVINDTQAGRDLAVFHTPGTSSALDTRVIAQAKDVGATGVFDRNLDGQTLTFTREGDRFVDEETGSTWNILGQAIDGPLAGEALTPIVHADHFWFSWAAFKPNTIIYSNSKPKRTGIFKGAGPFKQIYRPGRSAGPFLLVAITGTPTDSIVEQPGVSMSGDALRRQFSVTHYLVNYFICPILKR